MGWAAEACVAEDEAVALVFTAFWLDGRICRIESGTGGDDPDPCGCPAVCCGAGPCGYGEWGTELRSGMMNQLVRRVT